MKSAFETHFRIDDELEDETVDDGSVWEDLDDSDQLHVGSALDSVVQMQRLSCFAHSLQLFVCDGL